MKDILITGGAGFIGSNLALKLIKKGYHVTILDNLSPQIHGMNPENDSPTYQLIKDRVSFINGSVTSVEAWEKALNGQQVVIHLAAETGTGQSMYEVRRYTQTNIDGTAIFLDLLANRSIPLEKIILASSRAIYGEGRYRCDEHGFVYPGERSEYDLSRGDFQCKCPICGQNVALVSTDENSIIHPTSVYGITKQVQEQLVLTLCKSLSIPALSLRFQNVYGPGQSLCNPYTGILSIFSNRIRQGLPINIFEDGEESRDFVYIEDVVEAIIAGIEYKTATTNVYNVGTGVKTSVLTIARQLCKAYNNEVELKISGNYRLGDIRHNFADLSSIQRDLKFVPKWSVEEGLNHFAEWVEQQPTNKDNYELSLQEMKEKGLFK